MPHFLIRPQLHQIQFDQNRRRSCSRIFLSIDIPIPIRMHPIRLQGRWDTGADFVVLSSQPAAQLQLPASGPEIRMRSSTGRSHAYLIENQMLRFSDLPGYEFATDFL